MGPITLIVEFAIKPGCADAFEEVSLRARGLVAQHETGALRYDWWLTEDRKRGINIEIFRDSHALAEHMADVDVVTADLVANADVLRVEVLGKLTDEGHAAIDAAATGHFRLLGGIPA